MTESASGPRVLTYGDVPAEYRAGVEGSIVFDATELGSLSITGGDAEAFLHRILANRIRGLEPGEGGRNLLLTPKGKILHDFDLGRTSAGFSIVTAPGRAAALAAGLDMYLFADDVQVLDDGEEHAPLELAGPRTRAVLEKVLGEAPIEPHRTVEVRFDGHPATVVHLPVVGSPGWRIDAGPDRVEALWNALVDAGARPGGLVARDSLRVEAGRAVWGEDIDENVYPQEARLEEAFSLDKGCYIGQEVVAKIDTYGGLNKCLFALRVDHDDPVPRGARLVRVEDDERRDIGLVTSWAYSFALDSGVVLGYLKRKHQAVGTAFEIDDGPGVATIVRLPLREGAVPVTGDQP